MWNLFRTPDLWAHLDRRRKKHTNPVANISNIYPCVNRRLQPSGRELKNKPTKIYSTSVSHFFHHPSLIIWTQTLARTAPATREKKNVPNNRTIGANRSQQAPTIACTHTRTQQAFVLFCRKVTARTLSLLPLPNRAAWESCRGSGGQFRNFSLHPAPPRNPAQTHTDAHTGRKKRFRCSARFRPDWRAASEVGRGRPPENLWVERLRARERVIERVADEIQVLIFHGGVNGAEPVWCSLASSAGFSREWKSSTVEDLLKCVCLGEWVFGREKRNRVGGCGDRWVEFRWTPTSRRNSCVAFWDGRRWAFFLSAKDAQLG